MITSNSAIQTFKSCRRMYELRYVYNLTPVAVAEPLQRGLQYHDIVEKILNSEQWDCDDPKVKAMGKAFEKYVYPNLKDVVKSTEDWFEYKTPSGHVVIGKTDGLTKQGSPIEHKTTGALIDGAYFSRLEMDEQIMTYMTAHSSNFVFYDVCSTPTIRQKKKRTDDDFTKRCLEWFEENTNSKIVATGIVMEDDVLNRFRVEQDKIITEMENCKLYYRNPSHCMKWGRLCEYAPICMKAYLQEADLIGFERKEHKYEKT